MSAEDLAYLADVSKRKFEVEQEYKAIFQKIHGKAPGRKQSHKFDPNKDEYLTHCRNMDKNDSIPSKEMIKLRGEYFRALRQCTDSAFIKRVDYNHEHFGGMRSDLYLYRNLETPTTSVVTLLMERYEILFPFCCLYGYPQYIYVQDACGDEVA